MDQFAFVSPPSWTVAAFVVVLLGVQGMLLLAAYRAAADPSVGRRWALRTGLGFVALTAVSCVVAESGVMARQTMPLPTMVYFMSCNAVTLVLALTSPGRVLAAALPPAFWLCFQGFRLPLETVLHLWQEAGTIPVQMSWSGQNLDVLSGIVALALGWFWWRRPEARWAGWVGHAVGLALLFNVARIALLSIPSPFRVFEGPPLLLPMHAPYLLVLPFAVCAALFAHIVGIRALLQIEGRENGGHRG